MAAELINLASARVQRNSERDAAWEALRALKLHAAKNPALAGNRYYQEYINELHAHYMRAFG